MANMRLRVNPAADDAIGEALAELLREKIGPRIRDNAARTVPVRSGDLKRSIILQVAEDGDGAVLQVGVDEDIAGVDYSAHVEDGTSRQAPQPYLRPAVYQAQGVVR